MTCKDPAWMRSNDDNEAKQRQFSNENTFYPAGTECYRDPSQGSCFLFGNSGSGLVRPFNESSPDQHAYTGPLSMSKSCDQIWLLNKAIQYSSENPGVFTDAYCYLPWIAAIYGMKLPKGYTKKPSCGESKGRLDAIDEAICLGQDAENLNRGRCKNWQGAYTSEYGCQQEILENGTLTTMWGSTSMTPSPEKLPLEPRQCDFENHNYTKNGMNMVWNHCMLEAREGYAYNIYMCKVRNFQNLSLKLLLRMPMGTT